MTTPDPVKNVPGSPVTGNPNPTNASSGQKVLSEDELKALKGGNTMTLTEFQEAHRDAKEGEVFDEVPIGTVGYADLDEAGRPTGTIKARMDIEKPQAPVMNVVPLTPDALVTPSGAPITSQMNPIPTHYDAGLLERNPPGGGSPSPQSYERVVSDTSARSGTPAPKVAEQKKA